MHTQNRVLPYRNCVSMTDRQLVNYNQNSGDEVTDWLVASTVYLNFCCDGNWIGKQYHLPMETAHRQDLAVVFGELHTVNPCKQFLEVRLDDGRLCGLTQDLQQVIVTNKIEARKGRTLLLPRESKEEEEQICGYCTHVYMNYENGLPSYINNTLHKLSQCKCMIKHICK